MPRRLPITCIISSGNTYLTIYIKSLGISYLGTSYYPAIPLVCESKLKELKISGMALTHLRSLEKKGGLYSLLLCGGLSENSYIEETLFCHCKNLENFEFKEIITCSLVFVF